MKRFLIKFGVVTLFAGFSWSRIFPMPLHPDFVLRLRGQGKLNEVTRAYKQAQDRWQIDRVRLNRTGERTLKLSQPLVSGSGIAVLVDFSDNPADTINHPPAAYETLLYSVNTYPTGSLKDFYIENSFGQFNFSGGVSPPPPRRSWHRSSRTYEFYSDYYGFSHSQELCNEAAALADPFIDFGKYDNDGPDGVPNSGDDDGIVDAFYVVHAGPGYEEGCGKIWSHMSWTNWTTNDRAANGGYIKIGPYSIQPEEHCNGTLIDVGVFCHEYGHILGLPDLYDYDYDSYGAGNWTLMASGSWNGNAGSSPAHLDAWCKTYLGWVDPVVVNDYMVQAPIPEIEHNPVVYKLWTSGAPDEEYFLVENRQKTGLFDSFIPGSGLLIYHIDEGSYGNDNQYIPGESSPGSAHFQVAVEQADGLFQLERNTNPGDIGDPFPGSKNRNYIAGFLPYPTTFDYNENDTKVAVLDISPSDSLMFASFDVGRYLPFLFIKSYSLDDRTGGDGDGRAEPGETAELTVVLENRWGNGVGVDGQLRSNDPEVTIASGRASFGVIQNGSTGDNHLNPFVFTVASSSQTHQAELVLELTSSLPGYTKSDTIRLMVGWPGIFVVDDDGGDSAEISYERALDSLNLLYDYWNVEKQGSIATRIVTMGLQDSIYIWFTGKERSTLSAEDISALSCFLDAGGRLFLSSENAGEDLHTNSFYANYLHARFLAPDAHTPILISVPNDPIGQNDSLAMGYIIADSKDIISPIPPATMVFTYDGFTNGGAGIKYRGTYQVVYFSFPFEAVAGSPKRFLQQKDLLARVLTWLGLPVGIGEERCLAGDENSLSRLSVLPNPFSNTVVFQFQLSQSQNASLKIYDARGSLVATLLETATQKPARYNLRFNSGQLPAGVYFYRLATERITKVGKLILLR